MNFRNAKELLLVAMLLCFSVMTAQTVTGVVSGSDGVPLPGATVIVKNTTNGTVTDFDGNYEINNVPNDAVLAFSYIGYTPREIAVDGRTVINISLTENAALLDEVVVVGYGTQKKSEISTSIASVDGDDIAEIPVADIGQALQGRAAGVNITNNGSPGGKTLIRIRGLSTFNDGDPLIVVDGVFTDNINSINPSSIQKVDVLKDAAATAIYGSRGANGVIIVTTDKGTRGKTSFKFGTYSGVQFSNQRYDVLNTEQYLQFLREIATQPADGATAGFLSSNPTFDGDGVDTNWQDELFRSALMTNYDFNASGGNDNGRFSFGFSAFDQDGIFIDTNFKRYTLNFNSEANVFKGFKVGQNLSYGYSETIGVELSGGRQPLQNAVALPPFIPVRDENGVFGSSLDSVDGNDANNIVQISATNDNLNRFTSLFGNLYVEFELVKGLTVKTQYGLNTFFSNQDNISRAFQTTGRAAQDFTSLVKNRQRFVSEQLTNILTYQNSFGEHNFNLTLVSETLDSKFEAVNTSSNTDLSSEIEEINLGQSTSFSSPDKLTSYLGRLNYDFDSKYLLQLSIRRDNSSKFPTDKAVGWFPAASLAWVASKESFLEDTAINDLKFKASYGVTGNNRIGLNEFTSTIATDFLYAVDNATADPGAFINGGINPDLQWEEAIKQNYGFEMGLWENKLTLGFDYFINSSEKLLLNDRTSPSDGIPSGFITRNIGDIEVKGFEVTFGINDYEGEFKWNLWANVSKAESTVRSLSDNLDQILLASVSPPFSEQLTRLAPDLPLYHFFGYVMEGVYVDDQEVIDQLGDDNLATNPNASAGLQFQGGDVRFRDINGDGDITDADRTVIGDPNPDFTYAINLSASYKGFDASALITGVQGVDILNANTWYLQSQDFIANFGTEVLRRWQQPGDVTDVPRFRLVGNNSNNFISTRYIEDGSYARLKNVTLGYSLSDTTLDNVFNGVLSKVRFYAQSQNLLTLTKYSGYDPEVQPIFGGGGIIQGIGIDIGRQPQPTTVLFGLQLEF